MQTQGNRFIIAVALLASACAKTTSTGPAAGKAYFIQAGCASCHRIGAQGSAVGPDLTLVGFRHTPEWLDALIQDPQAWKPDTLMPNKRLSTSARKAIVEYLSGLKGQDWPRGSRPWDGPSFKDPSARGREIYVRAGCIACHGADGTGGYPNPNAKGGAIPALDKVAEGYSKTELISKIRRGVASPQKADPAGPAPQVAMPAWGEQLTENELDALASYLLTISSAKAERADW